MKRIFSHGIFLLIALISTTKIFAQVSGEVQFQHEGLTLHGTLMKPANEGKFPLVIIGPGSGANDRNATTEITDACLYPNLVGQTLHPYKELAEGLAKAGYAVLRYDKPEFTYGQNLGEVTFAKLWRPLASAIDFAKTRSDIDTTKIFLAGHSESGIFIPYIAQIRPGIRGLISIAGPRMPFDSILAYQMRTFPRLCGSPDTTTLDQQAAQILQYNAYARAGTPGLPPLFGVPAAVWKEYYQIDDSVSIHYNRAALPTLFIGFGSDLNVPVTTNLNRFRQDVPNADFYELAGLNHFMTPMNDPHVSQKLIDTIVYWLSSRITSVEENFSTEEIFVSPNPANDFITVHIPEGNFSFVEMCSALGEKILSQNISSRNVKISLAGIANGMYYIKLSGEKFSSSRKIIIAR